MQTVLGVKEISSLYSLFIYLLLLSTFICPPLCLLSVCMSLLFSFTLSFGLLSFQEGGDFFGDNFKKNGTKQTFKKGINLQNKKINRTLDSEVGVGDRAYRLSSHSTPVIFHYMNIHP